MAKLQELLARKEALEREIEKTKKQERAEAIAKVRTLMSEYGLTLADLSSKTAKAPPATRKRATGKPVAKVAPKFRDAATGQTWSGRGLQPNWLKAALGGGRTIDEFRI